MRPGSKEQRRRAMQERERQKISKELCWVNSMRIPNLLLKISSKCWPLAVTRLVVFSSPEQISIVAKN